MNSLIPMHIRGRLARTRRRLFEAFGSARYSRPSQNGYDRTLERFLDFDGGFFVEAGANDGYQQSNTYYFEKLRGWTGVLVEPIPELAAECRRNRTVPVVEAALVADQIQGARVSIHYAGLMSILDVPTASSMDVDRHVKDGLRIQGLPASYTVAVPTRTLSSILDEVSVGRQIDLLSLDVEGAEVGALQGIDWERHAPRFILIEARDQDVIDRLLLPRYERVAVLSDHDVYADVLYRRI